MLKTDLAYAAGIIDGEGCITIQRRKGAKGNFVGYALRVIVTMNDRPVIEELHSNFGGAVRHVTKKNVWTWEVSSTQAESVLQAVLPWLHGKKEQAVFALRFRKLAMPPGKRPTEENMITREKLYWKLRELKQHII